MSLPIYERDETRFCVVCCRHSDGVMTRTSQGLTCEDCTDFVQHNDVEATLIRQRAREGACPACGSRLRNNTKCASCRANLMNGGMNRLLADVLRAGGYVRVRNMDSLDQD